MSRQVRRPRTNDGARLDGGSSRSKAPARGQGSVPPNAPPVSINSSDRSPFTRFHLTSSPPSGALASARWGQPSGSGTAPCPPPGKVAIPALRIPPTIDASSKRLKKGRTAHACNHCRKTKAACTGETSCSRCRIAGVICEYGDGKREAEKRALSRLSKETGVLSQHNAHVADALRRIQFDTRLSNADTRSAIEDVLLMSLQIPAPELEGALPRLDTSRSKLEEPDDDQDGGSMGSVGYTNVDTDHADVRPIGYIGSSNSAYWVKLAVEECIKSGSREASIALPKSDIREASYHTEDADEEQFDTGQVNMMDWPDLALAHTFVQSYFENIHDAFPILDRRKFEMWYAHVKHGSMQQSEEDIIWLGTLNIIFAITSYHAHLTCAEHHRLHTDHLLYYARAKSLFLNDQFLYQDAKISTLCALGLLGLYHIATCRLNKAWTICGLAIRQALTLGLNVRSRVEDLADSEKEHRVRIWWSLYSLECLLNELTGRPSCISDADISTPLPINMDDIKFAYGKPFYDRGENVGGPSSQSSRRGSRISKVTSPVRVDSSKPLIYQYPSTSLLVTSSTYFICRVQLSIISHEILTNLYCASIIKVKWSVVQSTISRIDQRLLRWDSELPDKFTMNFDTYLPPEWNNIYFVPRIGLAMLYNSSRMILFRPCLCRFEDRLNHHIDNSKDFNQKAAEECIKCARRMIALLSWSSTSLEKIYAIPSWWHTLHCLCQALSILVLEIAFRAKHVPDEAGDIIEDVKRGVAWLSMMASRSISARKAWELFDKLIRLVSPLIDYSPFDMPTHAPIPPGYNWARYHQLDPNLFRMPQHGQMSLNHTQLSQPNLQQYEHEQPRVLSSDATNVWTSGPASFLSFNEGTLDSYVHQNAGNKLSHGEAVSRFSGNGSIREVFDEPWRHMFEFRGTKVNTPLTNLQANDIFNGGVDSNRNMSVGGQASLDHEIQMTGQEQRHQHQQFDPNLGTSGEN